MTPFSGTADAIHDPGIIAVMILKDIGWSVNYTGIESLNSPENILKVCPNPVENGLYICSLKSAINEIEVSDISGRKIITIQSPKFPIDVADLSSGIFFCKVKSGDKIFTAKFVKQ